MGRFRQLVATAPANTHALAALRRVTSVGGTPVDVRAALRAATPSEVRQRLHTLSRSLGSPTTNRGAADAPRDAARILAEGRFHVSQPPRPLKGLFDRLGAILARPIDRAGGFIQDLIKRLPGGSTTLWSIFIGFVLVAALLLASRAIRKRTRSIDRPVTFAGVPLLDPEELDRLAARAESDGDYARAIRLLYVAGILRLDRAGVISLTDSLTPRQIARQVGEPIVGLTETFEQVAYGGRPASRRDVEGARAAWDDLTARRAA